MNARGEPAGTNIDVMTTIFKELGVPYRFVLKEWGNALKTFERGDADLILANVRRYHKPPYFSTNNIINYNRIQAASLGDSSVNVSMKTLIREGVVLKPNDYTGHFFSDLDSVSARKVEYQSPKVAIQGILAGDNKYFVWGEEPIKWKLKELNIDQIVLNDVDIPVSEIHVIGWDKDLIYEIDDHFSRLKQSGEVERINDRWLHPERVQSRTSPVAVYLTLGAILLLILFWLLYRLARSRVRKVTSSSSEVNDMMYKALHMGSFDVMEYDIAADHMTNRYGSILPKDGLSLEAFASRIHPDEQEEFNRKMQMVLSGRLRKFELNKRWNAGTEMEPRWLTFHGHVLVELDAEGHPAYVINAIHDVTDDMEDDRAARELVNKYECLSNMPFVAMSFYDKEGWLVDLNDAMREMANFSSEEGERYFRTVCLFDMPLVRDFINKDTRDEQLVCQHMSYPEIPVERFIEFHVCPLFDKDGQLVNYYISTMDLLEEQRLDRELHLKNREIRQDKAQVEHYEWQLHYLLEKSNSYIWRSNTKDWSHVYTRSLIKDEYKQTYEEYLDCLFPDQREEILEIMRNQSQVGDVYSFLIHFSHTHDSDQPQWVYIAGMKQFDETGQLVGHYGLLRYVTELINKQISLKEEAQRAEDSGRQKSMFLASMTHELRTPLNSIVGFSDLLGSVETPEERREFIRIIRSNCDMLLRLINDILEASSIDDGPDSISPVRVDFVKAFNDICLTLAKRVQEPGVEFINDNPYDTYHTYIDIGRIQQVITNFVTNAVKYTHQGHIKVGYKLTTDPSGLYIYCEDTGAGIPKDKQEVVFERFVKLDEFVQGTGLGLAICKSIAERFGGTIGVHSEGEGKGSTFWLWVPCEKLED